MGGELHLECVNCGAPLIVDKMVTARDGTGYADVSCPVCLGKWRYVKPFELGLWELAVTLRFWHGHEFGGLEFEERLALLEKRGFAYEEPKGSLPEVKQLGLW